MCIVYWECATHSFFMKQYIYYYYNNIILRKITIPNIKSIRILVKTYFWVISVGLMSVPFLVLA